MITQFFSGKKFTMRFILLERIVIFSSFLFIALSFLFIYLYLFPEILSQSFVPLHYNIHSGIDRYGAWWRIFTIPVFGLLCLLLNMFIGSYWLKHNKLLHGFLFGITLFVEILLFIDTLFVISLNISFYG